MPSCDLYNVVYSSAPRILWKDAWVSGHVECCSFIAVAGFYCCTGIWAVYGGDNQMRIGRIWIAPDKPFSADGFYANLNKGENWK